MAITAMKHLTAVAMKQDVKPLLRDLMRLKCVELRKEEEKAPAADRSEAENEYSESLILQSKLERVIKTLTPRAPAKSIKETGMFGKKMQIEPDRFETSSGSFIGDYLTVERVEEIGYRMDEIKSEIQSYEGVVSSLNPWKGSEMPFEKRKTKETRIIFGTLPAEVSDGDLAEALSDSYCGYTEIGKDGMLRYMNLVCLKSAENDVMKTLSKLGFSRVTFRDYEGTAEENIERAQSEIKKDREEYEALDKELDEIAKGISSLRLAYDYTSTRCEQARARLLLTDTSQTVTLTGWVPIKAVEDVSATLEKSEAFYEFRDPEEGEEVPILLKNPKPADSFEGVIGMYSMPKYGSYDPTVVMSVFYFIIFGFMLADVAYGILITLGALLFMKIGNIQKSTKNMVRMFAVCGISCTVAGFLFGSYFGNFPSMFCEKMLGFSLRPLAAWFDPLNEPMMFLILSVAIGFVHLMAGLVIKAIELFKQGQIFAGIFDQLSWVVLFSGIVVAVTVDMTVGIVITGVAALALILTQGRAKKNPIMKLLGGVMSLYGIVNYLSDLLSYSRIMALGLSSAVVANVMNTLSTLIGPSVAGYIAMVIIFIVGHLLNIAINMLGTFVHTSRLQYIEFFGKFFEDGGKPFRPLEAKLKYSKMD